MSAGEERRWPRGAPDMQAAMCILKPGVIIQQRASGGALEACVEKPPWRFDECNFFAEISRYGGFGV